MYWEYLKYVIEHKRNVWRAYKEIGLDLSLECSSDYKISLKELRRLAILHDMSKFNPKEFIPYAKWFYGPYGVKFKGDPEDERHVLCKDDFDRAVNHHYFNNEHHWNHWDCTYQCFSIPTRYVREMILDWQAMSYKFGTTPQEWYLQNYNKIKLENMTRVVTERLLGLNNLHPHIDNLSMMTLKEIKDKGFDLNKVFETQAIDLGIDFNDFDI